MNLDGTTTASALPSTGVDSKFSVSGTVLTYVTTATYTGMSGGQYPWSDGTSVYGFTSSGVAKWALSGGAATQYTGAAVYPSYVVGVSQTSPWLALVSCNNVTASSDGIGVSTILTTVSYIPKF